jgi:hypothetical protein
MRRKPTEAELERMESRRQLIAEARARGEVELRDGREFRVLRLPDTYGQEVDPPDPRPRIQKRGRRNVQTA